MSSIIVLDSSDEEDETPAKRAHLQHNMAATITPIKTQPINNASIKLSTNTNTSSTLNAKITTNAIKQAKALKSLPVGITITQRRSPVTISANANLSPTPTGAIKTFGTARLSADNLNTSKEASTQPSNILAKILKNSSATMQAAATTITKKAIKPMPNSTATTAATPTTATITKLPATTKTTTTTAGTIVKSTTAPTTGTIISRISSVTGTTTTTSKTTQIIKSSNVINSALKVNSNERSTPTPHKSMVNVAQQQQHQQKQQQKTLLLQQQQQPQHQKTPIIQQRQQQKPVQLQQQQLQKPLLSQLPQQLNQQQQKKPLLQQSPQHIQQQKQKPSLQQLPQQQQKLLLQQQKPVLQQLSQPQQKSLLQQSPQQQQQQKPLLQQSPQLQQQQKPLLVQQQKPLLQQHSPQQQQPQQQQMQLQQQSLQQQSRKRKTPTPPQQQQTQLQQQSLQQQSRKRKTPTPPQRSLCMPMPSVASPLPPARPPSLPAFIPASPVPVALSAASISDPLPLIASVQSLHTNATPPLQLLATPPHQVSCNFNDQMLLSTHYLPASTIVTVDPPNQRLNNRNNNSNNHNNNNNSIINNNNNNNNNNSFKIHLPPKTTLISNNNNASSPMPSPPIMRTPTPTNNNNVAAIEKPMRRIKPTTLLKQTDEAWQLQRQKTSASTTTATTTSSTVIPLNDDVMKSLPFSSTSTTFNSSPCSATDTSSNANPKKPTKSRNPTPTTVTPSSKPQLPVMDLTDSPELQTTVVGPINARSSTSPHTPITSASTNISTRENGISSASIASIPATPEPTIDEPLPLTPEYEDLIKACREADNSADMERLIESKLLKYYHGVHPDFVRSRGFGKQLLEVTARIRADPDLVYYNLKTIVDELKVRRKCKQVVVNNEETPAAAGSTGNKRTDEQIKKLNKALYILTKRIEMLEEAEVDWEDEDSAYMQVERFKKRACQIYEKICDLTGESKNAHRLVKKPIQFSATSFPQFNKTLQAYINRTKEFPDYFDVKRMLEHCNRQYELGLANFEIKHIAHDAFISVGKLLQSRRKTDLYETVTHFTANAKDPAATDPELLAKLNENQKHRKKISTIIEKFAREQDMTAEEQREARLKEKLKANAAGCSKDITSDDAESVISNKNVDNVDMTKEENRTATENVENVTKTATENGNDDADDDDDEDYDDDDDEEDEEEEDDINKIVENVEKLANGGELSDAESDVEIIGETESNEKDKDQKYAEKKPIITTRATIATGTIEENAKTCDITQKNTNTNTILNATLNCSSSNSSNATATTTTITKTSNKQLCQNVNIIKINNNNSNNNNNNVLRIKTGDAASAIATATAALTTTTIKTTPSATITTTGTLVTNITNATTTIPNGKHAQNLSNIQPKRVTMPPVVSSGVLKIANVISLKEGAIIMPNAKLITTAKTTTPTTTASKTATATTTTTSTVKQRTVAEIVISDEES